MLIAKDALPCLHLKHGDDRLTIFANDDDHIEAISRLSAIIGCAIPLQRQGSSLIAFQDIAHFAASPTPWWQLDAYYKGSKSRGQRPKDYDRGGDFDKSPPTWPWGENDKWLDTAVVINEDGLVDGETWCRSCAVQLRCDVAGGPDWVVSDLNKKPYSGLAEGCAFARFSFGGMKNNAPTALHVMGKHGIDVIVLQEAGFTVLPTPMLFDAWHGRHGIRGAVENDEADITAVDMHEHGDDLGNLARFIRRAPMSYRPDIDDLCFDTDDIRANQMLVQIRGKGVGAKAAKTRGWKKRECTRCVYSCVSLPWDRPSTCHITQRRILNKTHVGEEDLLWMAHFIVAGKKGRFIGRPMGIGWGPMEGGMLIKSLHPPFCDIGVVDTDEYMEIDKDGRHRQTLEEVAEQLADVDDDKLRMSLWVLRWMHGRLRWDHRFYNHTQDNGRFARNDVLSIELYPDCSMISVFSETRASSTRMNYRGGYDEAYGDKGRSLTADDRPRFSTHYNYPYFEDLQQYAGVTPGSGREAA